MAVTKTYSRPKVAVVNSTGIDFTLKAAELAGTPAAFGGGAVGATGNFQCLIQADADESGGSDIQTIFRLETAMALSAAGLLTLTVTVTPVLGDASDGTPKSIAVAHEQNVDAWQSAAGRARQA